MTTQRLVLSTLVGGLVSFVLGGVIYGVGLAGFFEQHLGSASGVMRDPMVFWALALSELAGAALLTLVIGSWARVAGAAAGARLGAIVGLLVSIFFDFNIYGTTHVFDLTAALVDPVIGAARFAVTGAVIGVLCARRS